MKNKVAIIALIIFCFVIFLAGCGEAVEEEMPMEEIPTIAKEEAKDATPVGRQTVVYYPNSDGFIVPIMKELEWQDSMQQIALNELKQDNVQNMGIAGLLPVFAQDANINLYIKDGVAVVDLPTGSLLAKNEKEELNTVQSIVNTLCGFDNIDKVVFQVNGEKVSTLKNGTSVKNAFTSFDVNPQSMGKKIDMNKSTKVILYYPSADLGQIIPVTCYYPEKIDVAKAVEDLVGREVATSLNNPFPFDLKLLACNVSDNVATLNFSDAFGEIAYNDDMGASAIKSLYLTCLGFDNIDEVAILVNDVEYDDAVATMAMPKYPNTY